MSQTDLFDNRSKAELRALSGFGRRLRPLEGVVPSGSLTIDAATEVGGLPRGRMLELFGPASSGKSTVGLQIIAAVQRESDTAVLVDSDRNFDAGYAARLGVVIDKLAVVRTEDGKQALTAVEKLVHSKCVDLIVIDSVASLVSREELDRPAGETGGFGLPELLADGVRKIARVLVNSPTSVLFLNQVRAASEVGVDETAVGGWALKAHSAIRASLRAVAPIDKAGKRVGRRTELKIVKNQLGGKRQMEFDFYYGSGICRASELLSAGLRSGLLEERSDGIHAKDTMLGSSFDDARERLLADAGLFAQLDSVMRAALGVIPRKVAKRAPVNWAGEQGAAAGMW